MNTKSITPMEMGFRVKTHDYETYFVVTEVTGEQWYRVGIPFSNAVSFVAYVMSDKDDYSGVLDTVADFLRANELNRFYTTYSEAREKGLFCMETGEVEDMICCGNYGIYIRNDITIAPINEF